MTFFGWIIGLATVVVVLYPFSTSAPLEQEVATAAVDLVIGIAIGTLISGAGARSVRAGPLAGDDYLAMPPERRPGADRGL